jgi:Arc-like DNA binding domain
MVLRPLKETVQVNLRIKEALRRRLERAATKNGFSFNAEMVERLEGSFEREDAAPAMQALILENHRRVEMRQQTGEVLRGWISDTLRSEGFDSAKADEIGDFVKKYLGSL